MALPVANNPATWTFPLPPGIPPLSNDPLCAHVSPRRSFKTTRLIAAMVADIRELQGQNPFVVVGGHSTSSWVFTDWVNNASLDALYVQQVGQALPRPLLVYLDEYAFLPEDQWTYVQQVLLPQAERLKAVTSPSSLVRIWPQEVSIYVDN